MRVVVTGGAGFIGSHLTEALLERGADVLVVDDLSQGRRDNVPAGARLAVLDVTTAAVDEAIASHAPAAVFHLAAQMDVRKSVADPAFDANVNVVGTVRIVEAARRAGVGFFALASSGGAIYGEQEQFPAPESHPQRPCSPYGLSKSCGERYLELLAGDAMRSVALRFANVYGPRQDPHGEAGVVAIFCQRLLQGRGVTIYGDGKQTRDFIYVGDVVQAALAMLDAPGARGPYNIGTGMESDVLGIARMLTSIAQRSSETGFAPERRGEQRRSSIDPARAKHDVGWQPTTTLQQGLTHTYEWFRQAGRS